METLKIKSTHPESQGDFIIINAEDFDAETMQIYSEDEQPEVVEKSSRSRK